ncbi:MAG: hypothetical protein QM763_00780 [Agriterribacter sp.]
MAYSFSTQPPESLVILFPCSSLMHWPGYDTKWIKRRIDGRDVIIQLWKGYCPSYLPGLVGGVGAEIGLYKREGNSPLWWPDYNHKEKISFTLYHPRTERIFFRAAQQRCWWRHKWMTESSYIRYREDHPGSPSFRNSTRFRLEYKIVGSTNTITGTW